MKSQKSWLSLEGWALALLACVFIVFILGSPILPPSLQQDNLMYLRLAHDPTEYFKIGGIYAQRIVPPLIVWVLSKNGWLDVVTGFRVISTFAIGSFLFSVYISYRVMGLRPNVAVTASIFLLIGSWPIAYGLSNVYQACDAFAYPLALWFIVAIRRRWVLVAFLVGLLGVGCRQQLMILFLVGNLFAFWKSRRVIWLLAAITQIAVFGFLVATAGMNGVMGLMRHITVSGETWHWLIVGLLESKLPLLLSPYLLALPLFIYSYPYWLKQYCWILPFSAATAIQPLFAFEITGSQNTARLAMIGLWPLVFIGGFLVGRQLQQRGWSILFSISSIAYGTAHVVSFSWGYPCFFGHRIVVNILLAIATILTFHCNKLDEEKFIDHN